MKNILYVICVVSFFFSLLVSGQESAKSVNIGATNHTADMIKEDVEILDTGVRFYGSMNFECGDGELSIVSDLNGTEIVPLGAVLCAIKRDYVLGYYKGAISVKYGEAIKRLEKIFFTLERDGITKFYYPGNDPNFIGKQIAGEVIFE